MGQAKVSSISHSGPSSPGTLNQAVRTADQLLRDVWEGGVKSPDTIRSAVRHLRQRLSSAATVRFPQPFRPANATTKLSHGQWAITWNKIPTVVPQEAIYEIVKLS